MRTEVRGWHNLLLALGVLVQIGFCWAARTRSLQGQVDLRAFYTAGAMLRTGHAAQLYRYADFANFQSTLFGNGQVLPFLYPAIAAWLFVPLSELPYRLAFLAWSGLNLGLAMTAFHLLFPRSRRLWLGLASLSFFPVAIALMQGQLSFLLLLVLALFACLLRRHRPLAAGLCLSLAMVKFQIALPVALLYLLWRQYRVVTGFVAGSTAMALLSVATTGIAGAREYLASLAHIGSSTLLDPVAAHLRFGMLASDMPNLHGIAAGFSTDPHVVIALTLVGSVAVLAWSSRHAPSVTIALPAAMLASYHLQPYDLVLLLVPLSLVRWSRTTWAGVIVLTVPIGPWLLVNGQTRWMALGTALIWVSACGFKLLPFRGVAKGVLHRAEEQHA